MGEVHDLIERSGKRAALLMADLDRQVVEAAAAYMADEDAGTGCLYSGWCQAALPHRKLPEPDGQGSLFAETARLSEAFFAQLQRHPVPIEEAAIRAINNDSMALDIYAWLAYRLHVLSAPKHVTWKALRPQFGGGVARDDHF